MAAEYVDIESEVWTIAGVFIMFSKMIKRMMRI